MLTKLHSNETQKNMLEAAVIYVTRWHQIRGF